MNFSFGGVKASQLNPPKKSSLFANKQPLKSTTDIEQTTLANSSRKRIQ
jgi:hypothetical protein